MRSVKVKSPNSTFQKSGDIMFKRPYLSKYYTEFVDNNTIRKHLMSAFDWLYLNQNATSSLRDMDV